MPASGERGRAKDVERLADIIRRRYRSRRQIDAIAQAE
jgi:hypothetical protein